MWHCDCAQDGSYKHSVTLTRTHVDKHEVCKRCNHYAVWIPSETIRRDDGSYVNRKVTVFNLNTDKHKYFNNTVEAAKWAGYQYDNAISSNMKDTEKYYYSKAKGIAVCAGHKDKIPRTLQKLIDKNIYCYEYSTGKLIATGDSKYMQKKFGYSRHVIVSNLNRTTMQTKEGLIFSRSENFDVGAFRRSVELPDDQMIGPQWQEEVLSYEDSEMGIEYVYDTYGTWIDLLYT